MKKTTCSKCNLPLEPNRQNKYRYCKSCHNEYMKLKRPKYSDLSEHDKLKSNCRSYLNTYLKRGKIQKTKCVDCGNSNVQAHHHDYTKPLDVIWLCVTCHIKLHKHI